MAGFALLHLQAGGWTNVISAAIFAALASALVVRTRSLSPAVLAHAAYNLTIALLLRSGAS